MSSGVQSSSSEGLFKALSAEIGARLDRPPMPRVLETNELKECCGLGACFGGVSYLVGCHPIGAALSALAGCCLGYPSVLHKWTVKSSAPYEICVIQSGLLRCTWESLNQSTGIRQRDIVGDLLDLQHVYPIVDQGRGVVFLSPVWVYSVNEKRIHLFNLRDHLVYQSNDLREPNRLNQGPIQMEGLPMQVQIAYLTQACRVDISQDGVPSFTPPLSVQYRWESYKEKEVEGGWGGDIYLLQEGGDWIWEVRESKHVMRAAQRALSGHYASHFRDSTELSTAPGFNPQLPIKDQLKYFQNHSVCVYIKEHKIQSIFLRKRTEISILSQRGSYREKKKPVSAYDWAVTLIDSGSSLSNPGTWGGHSQIIVEGLKVYDGEDRPRYFMQRADIVARLGTTILGLPKISGPAQVRLDEVEPKKLRWSGKSETFLIDRRKVEWMLNEIEAQKASSREFNLIFDNCLVWAMGRLATVGLVLRGGFDVKTPNTALDYLCKEGKS